MNKPPLVSVLMPVKNQELYLQSALDSILGQTYRNLEVILVDDGSEDLTPRIARQAADLDSRVRFVLNHGSGKVAALNTAYGLAQGELIRLFAGDDWTRADCIEKCVGAINGDFVAAYHDFMVVDSSLRPLHPWVLGESMKRLSFESVISSFKSLPSGSWLWNRDAVPNALPIPQALGFEDVWLSFQIKGSGKVQYIQERLLWYRQHGSQTYGRLSDFSKSRWQYRCGRNKKVADYILDHPEKIPQLDPSRLEELRSRSIFFQIMSKDGVPFKESMARSLKLRERLAIFFCWLSPDLFLLIAQLKWRLKF